MSRATALASTAQQISQSIGTAVGALLLNLALAWRDQHIFGPEEFRYAFWGIAATAAVSAPLFLNLQSDAGKMCLDTARLKMSSLKRAIQQTKVASFFSSALSLMWWPQ